MRASAASRPPGPRAVHFFDPANPRMRERLSALTGRVDVLLGNLEDAIPAAAKEAARRGLVEVGRGGSLGGTPLWTRINGLDSPWALDDLSELVAGLGGRLDVAMVPKVEGPWDLHYVDRLLSQLEARHDVGRRIGVHAILETAAGVANCEEIALASPRLRGISFGPGDLAASRRMKTTRVGGGHPGYRVLADPGRARRPEAQQDLWHYSIARMVDACALAGIAPLYGPFGDIADLVGCEVQLRAAAALGCVGAWTLHPAQVEIAQRVFAPNEPPHAP